MDVFIGLLCFIWSILCLILFFKVWGMCNNVAKILQELTKPNGDARNEIPSSYKLEIGDVVCIKSKGKESTVVAIKGDKYECASMNGNFYDGLYERNDLIKR